MIAGFIYHSGRDDYRVVMGLEKPKPTPAQLEREEGNQCYKVRDYTVRTILTLS